MDISTKMRQLRRDTRNELNHTYIWSTVAVDALKEKFDDDTYVTKTYFPIPTKKGENKIKLNKSKVLELLNNSIEFDLYYSLIAITIAKFESYLSNVVNLILDNDPRKLLDKVNGINHQKNIPINDIILSESRNELINSLIQTEILNVFYSSPKKQREYFETVLGIKLDQEIWELWFEYKATRDIIIHNNGIINSIYLEKSGQKARGEIGERISIDQKYFNDLLVNLKIFTNKIYAYFKK